MANVALITLLAGPLLALSLLSNFPSGKYGDVVCAGTSGHAAQEQSAQLAVMVCGLAGDVGCLHALAVIRGLDDKEPGRRPRVPAALPENPLQARCNCSSRPCMMTHAHEMSAS